jgi:uncharacterized repeat protein (TIGR01451 family)
LVNTATVIPPEGTTDPTPGDNSAIVTAVVEQVADLTLSKEDQTDPLPAGQDLVYVLTVENLGPSDATRVEVTDALPAEVSYISDDCGGADGPPWSWMVGELEAGATATCNLTVSLGPDPPGSILNSATVTWDGPDPAQANNTDREETGVDVVLPGVVAIDRLGGDGELAQCETARAGILGFTVGFSEEVVSASPGDPASATNPANYRLVTPASGAAGFSTTDCLGGTGGDGVIPIDEVAYDGATHTATVAVNQGEVLPDQLYRLLVCGTIEDLAGNPLDGRTGAGTDFSRTFRVDRFNRLADGHFDRFDPAACTLDAWTTGGPGTVELALPDATGSPLSGSAHNADPFVPLELSQCVELGTRRHLDLEARVQMGLAVAGGPPASVRIACRLFDGPACGGGILQEPALVQAIFDTEGAFVELDGSIEAPSATVSALCAFVGIPPPGSGFDAYFDDLFLGDTSELFSDGFEGGNSSAWTATVP